MLSLMWSPHPVVRPTPASLESRFSVPSNALTALAVTLLLAPWSARAHPDPDGQVSPIAPGSLQMGEGQAGGSSNSAAQASTEEKGKGSSTDKKPSWDVNVLQGPTRDIAIDTDEGTWMSVDVSPDGQELIFDLLGDLYRLPIAGGDAKALTSGAAWDMQPRYSPDGRFIAFTSDRSGGDNLWVMNRDGSNPVQVTQEDFRLLNSPAWSPDSQYLVGRKHFTAQRSLGAGEIWIYHRSGSGGLQLTKKPNDQKDVGEPALSPDGRYLYFSQDVTPGPFFEYNKDPNPGIYAILRLDRETGELETFIGGPGGAIRPTPSPDGKSLAFIRRVRAKSVLFVHDLASGQETPLFDGLDRDMQETWAIHGVYPSMSWTPDNKALVLWANGKLHRLDVATRAVTPIPFRVKASRTLQDALRYPQVVAPEKQQTKMLRHVQVSPDGKQVMFQALGYIYVRDLPDGTPRRLTSQNEHFEYFPSWARDGKSVVYVSWHDQQLGAIRRVSAKGGIGKVLTPAPGHYLEPMLSPDGKTLVYQKTTGGYLVSRTWSHDAGLFVLSLDNDKPVGMPRRLTPRGQQAHFGSRSDRLYFLRGSDDDQTQLFSIELDGSDEKQLFTSERAFEIKISPDERWVAFRERFNAFIVPFVRTGQPVSLAPDMKSLPVRRVSKDAGEYLSWSGDSNRLSWVLGPELFQVELKDAFPFVPGAPEKLPDPPATGRFIGLEFAGDVPSGTLAFVGGRIITLKGDEVIEKGTVIVTGNRITTVGPSEKVTIPSGARVIDVTGKTLMPGLVDVHYHGGQGMNAIIPQQNYGNYAALAFGVTTAHDPSNDTGEVFAAAELQRAGKIVGPRIFSTGTILYGAKASVTADIDSYEDALQHLVRMKAVGAFSVKSYNQPRRNQRQQVIAAARATQMMVVPEGGSTFMHNMTMVVDGHTGVEHAIPVAMAYRDVQQLWGQSQVGYTPTLGVGYGGMGGELFWYQTTDVYDHPRLKRFVPQDALDARARRRGMAPLEEYNHFKLAKTAKGLLDAGVHVHLGAHGQREGLAAHWELWMFAQGGMTPLEALRAGTLAGAQYLGLDKDLGSLEAGKLADMIVLEKNPLEDIRNSETVQYTLINGRLFDAWSMDEVGNHPKKRQKFWFETASEPTMKP